MTTQLKSARPPPPAGGSRGGEEGGEEEKLIVSYRFLEPVGTRATWLHSRRRFCDLHVGSTQLTISNPVIYRVRWTCVLYLRQFIKKSDF